MDLRVKKGTKLAEVYYMFLFFENEKEYKMMIDFYEVNLWWFKKFPEEAIKECQQKYNLAKIIVNENKVNLKAEKFFNKIYGSEISEKG
ncbi:MAG: hypothetical protein ACRC6E_10590 [Fusobacteriaceae bacterium]